MASASTVDLKIVDVNGHHSAVPPFLAHCNQACVRKVDRLIGVLANQLADTGMVFTEIPWTNQQTVGDCIKDRSRIVKKEGCFGQNRLAGIQRTGKMAQHVLRPNTKLGFFTCQRGHQRPCVQKVDHLLALPRRRAVLNAARLSDP